MFFSDDKKKARKEEKEEADETPAADPAAGCDDKLSYAYRIL